MSLPWPPRDSGELAEFPRRPLTADAELWRVTRVERGPWWFGGFLTGRFDLSAPEGTCYLATDPLSALLEVTAPQRRGGVVAEEFLAGRRLWCLRVPEERSLADLASRRAARWLTLEIHTVTPYDRPQAWAQRLHEAGAQGLWYLVRHDPGGDPAEGSTGVALFGAAGERKDWRRGRGRPIPRDLMRRLEGECGIAVRPRPRLAELRTVGV